MKNFYLIIGAACLCPIARSQTLTLQPDGAAGKDALLSSLSPTNNYGTYFEFNGSAWTVSGDESICRSLIEFDLAAIAPGSVVASAYLTLYNNSTSPINSGQHSNLSGSNTCVLQKVINDWDENTVTWNTQPSVTITNQVFIPATVSPSADVTIDVTDMVQDMVNYPGTNYGFMLKLVTENYYRGMLFASSDHADPSKHPKLVINYSPVSVTESKNTLVITHLVPNILTDQAYIPLDPGDAAQVIPSFTDVSGKTVALPFVSEHNRIVVDRGTASAGLYIYRLMKNGNLYSTGKFVIR